MPRSCGIKYASVPYAAGDISLKVGHGDDSCCEVPAESSIHLVVTRLPSFVISVLTSNASVANIIGIVNCISIEDKDKNTRKGFAKTKLEEMSSAKPLAVRVLSI